MAARSIVITSLSAGDCHVFRRYVDPVNDQQTRNETVYPGAEVLGSHEEHATRYELQGFAKLLFDRFTGGSIWSNSVDLNIGEATISAQVEPFNIEDYGLIKQMQSNIPDWTPEKGDIFALMISDQSIKWLECIGVKGISLPISHGVKYMFNVRDPLEHLEPFTSQEDLLKPAVNKFPTDLSKLIYSALPILSTNTQGTATINDDEVTVWKFKLLTPHDGELSSNVAVANLFSTVNYSNTPFTFTKDDTTKIHVDLGENETYVLSAESPVNAVLANNEMISYFLIGIDHKNLVNSIKGDLALGQTVKVSMGDIHSFDIMPMNYDPVRKLYLVVVMATLGTTNQYSLSLLNGESYSFNLDLTQLQGA